MAGFNLDDYEPVAVRLGRFLEKYPDGAIHTEIVFDDGIRIVIKATAWRHITDPMPAGVDYAEELLSDRGVNATSRVENCATSAAGRVLSLLGFAGTDWTKKPSREEMAKAARTGNIAGPPSGASSGGMATEKQRGYIRKLAWDRDLKDPAAVDAAIATVLQLDAPIPLTALTAADASKVIDAWRTGA
jgi:hypothetical protein